LPGFERRLTRRIQALGSQVALNIDDMLYGRWVATIVGFLPASLAYGVAQLRADLLSSLADSRKGKTACLELLFGDKLSPDDRREMAREYFRVRSCEPIDTVRLFGDGRRLLGLVEVRGLEHLKAAHAAGRGAVICSAHLSAPRVCFSIIGALGFPIRVVARWTYGSDRDLKYEGGWLQRRSLHLHGPNIARASNSYMVAVQAAQALRRNEFVGIMVDSPVGPSDPSRPSKFAFLGRTISLVPGATTIAYLTGSPIVPALLLRSSDCRHQVLQVMPPIHVADDPRQAFVRCLAVIEDTISRFPAQWSLLGKQPLSELGLLPAGEHALENRE